MTAERIQFVIHEAGAFIQAANDANTELERRKEFAKEASKSLGYSSLEQTMSNETVDIPVDVVLLKNLLALDIIPLDRKSVLRYKDAMAGNQLNVFLKGFGFPIMFAGIVATLVLAWAAAQNPVAAASEINIHWLWPALAGIGFAMVWAEHAIFRRSYWREPELKHYSSWGDKSTLLPREALEIAMRVKARLPDVGFRVHHLVLERGPWFKAFGFVGEMWNDDPDPFLEVYYGGESYFIAVWDEPGFDGKLKVVE